MTLHSLLVGAYYRPPAKQLLQFLPAGTILELRPEPENPWDPDALAVYVDTGLVPEPLHEALGEALQGTGYELEELLDHEPCHLGYVAKTGGKPLVKAGMTIGNAEFLAAGATHAKLGFLPDGQPTVTAMDGRK